jgi:hypothetical protein
LSDKNVIYVIHTKIANVRNYTKLNNKNKLSEQYSFVEIGAVNAVNECDRKRQKTIKYNNPLYM